MRRLAHDVCWQTAARLAAAVASYVGGDDLRTCHAEFYRLLMEGIEEYERRKEWERERVNPHKDTDERP